MSRLREHHAICPRIAILPLRPREHSGHKHKRSCFGKPPLPDHIIRHPITRHPAPQQFQPVSRRIVVINPRRNSFHVPCHHISLNRMQSSARWRSLHRESPERWHRNPLAHSPCQSQQRRQICKRNFPCRKSSPRSPRREHAREFALHARRRQYGLRGSRIVFHRHRHRLLLRQPLHVMADSHQVSFKRKITPREVKKPRGRIPIFPRVHRAFGGLRLAVGALQQRMARQFFNRFAQ